MQKLTKAEYLFFASSNTISPKLEDRTLQSNNTFLDQPITQLLILFSVQIYIFFSIFPKINQLKPFFRHIFCHKTHHFLHPHSKKSPFYLDNIQKSPIFAPPNEGQPPPPPPSPSRPSSPAPFVPVSSRIWLPSVPVAAVFARPLCPRRGRLCPSPSSPSAAVYGC